MVALDNEIDDRLEEKDSARSARRRQAARTVGDLARRHADLAGKLADLEGALGEVLTAAGDVIDVPELAEVTDVPAADLARWRDQAAKPARSKRHRTGARTNPGGTGSRASTTPRAARPASTAPDSAAPDTVGSGPAAAAGS